MLFQTERKIVIVTGVTLLLWGALAGCTGDDNDREREFRAAVPNVQAVTMSFPGDAGSSDGTARSGLLGERAYLFEASIETAESINGYIWEVFSTLEDIMESEPSFVSETEAHWGPMGHPLHPLVYRLVVEDELDGTFTFAMEAKRREADDGAFSPILAGSSEIEASTGMSRGALFIDYATLRDLDPIASEVEAIVWIGYDTIDEPRAVALAYEEAPPAPGAELLYADYIYGEFDDGSGFLDYFGMGGLDEEGFEYPNVALGTIWDMFGQGRGDIFETGGYLGDLIWFATECWDDGFGRTFYEDNFYPEENEGELEACISMESLWEMM